MAIDEGWLYRRTDWDSNEYREAFNFLYRQNGASQLPAS